MVLAFVALPVEDLWELVPWRFFLHQGSVMYYLKHWCMGRPEPFLFVSDWATLADVAVRCPPLPLAVQVLSLYAQLPLLGSSLCPCVEVHDLPRPWVRPHAISQ